KRDKLLNPAFINTRGLHEKKISCPFHRLSLYYGKTGKTGNERTPFPAPLDQASHVTNHQLKKTCHENKFFMDRMFNCHNRL
ncbi:hypothetical protein, partial [Akkermansia sp.]|uniref:hypothetical protein n=1 Tax=Akkermansia sp. TaxID=1872421 RepID=UPI002584E799